MFDLNGGRKYLNDAERQAYLRVIESEPNDSRRAFLLTLYYSGCRISEALNLQAGRVDQRAKAVVFETLKRRRKGLFRSVPVPSTLSEALQCLVQGKLSSDRVWKFSRSTAYRMVKAKMREARIVGGMAMPKGLRHGHGVACVARNVPLPTIQRWLGHARLETTAIYLAVQGDEEREFARRLWEPPSKANRPDRPPLRFGADESGRMPFMNLTVELPDAIAYRLQLDGPDAQRRALELLAVRGYESGKLSGGQVGDLLGLSFCDTKQFLKDNGAVIPMTVEDVCREAVR